MTTKYNEHRRFYVAMAWIGALIATTGFARRYFMPLAGGTFQAPAIVHLHGVITLTWVAFLILQTTLVSTGRTAFHRSIGMAGIALATLVVFTASEVAILQLARELKEGGAITERIRRHTVESARNGYRPVWDWNCECHETGNP